MHKFPPVSSGRRQKPETFEKCSILFKFKEGENFNHRNTFSILRIKLKLHCVQNVELDTEIGQKGAFCKCLNLYHADAR
jgi:hypothetical protein